MILKESRKRTWKDRKEYKASEREIEKWEHQYQELFAIFNRLYFSDRLPFYRVSLHEGLDVPGIPPDMSKHVAGYCDKKGHRIDLEAFPFPKGQSILLHEMAHVASNVHHGPKFCQEMERLAAAGAPIGKLNIMNYVASFDMHEGHSRAE